MTLARRGRGGSVPREMSDAAPTETPTRFLTLFWASPHRANLCTAMLLAWLSACDGTVAPEEEAFIRRAYAGGDAVELEEILAVAKAGSVDDLEVACRYAAGHFSRAQKRL